MIKEWPDIDVPMVCLQCLTAPCAKACPVDAISLDRKFGVMIEENKCIGCQKCILACPVAAIWMHPTKNIALKCDLCLGDPVCTKYCPTGVISLVEIDRFLGDKQASYGKRFSKVHKRA